MVTAPRIDPALDGVRRRVEAGERLSLDDGDLLYRTPDIWSVCELADVARRRLHGDTAYYNVNRHLNYSNVCALSCSFCDFFAKRGDDRAYTRSLREIRAEAERAAEAGATEMHIVGGLDPYLPWEYYPQMLATIREAAPSIHIKAFTAVEIVHLAKVARVYKGATLGGEEGRAARMEGIAWVLERLIAAGLGSLPGGGAEVFDDRVHDEAFKGKIRSDVWLDVHRVAHHLGLNSNATMLYGHIEDRHERLAHMDMLRRVQDDALAGFDSGSGPLGGGVIRGRFQTIIPLPFFPDGSALERLPGPSGLENLRTLAICRLMLDNFPHVKAFWIMQTLGMAQLMLQCGADDIDGTVVWYDITKVGGAGTHQEVSVADLQRAIREAGFTPVERDTLYRRVGREGKNWWVEGDLGARLGE
ncbi:MAG: CofH family radical SAM protein [Phycisphaeraceae bacterium]|nr:CofH family radical SAM protein [Phycisphaeraceae bacterium]